MTHELQSICDRLEKVERENRLLKRAGIGVLVVACAGMLMGQAKSSRTIETDRLEVKRSDGGMSIVLDATRGYAMLDMYDEAGLQRASLAADTNETCLSIWDSKAKHYGQPSVKLCETVSDGPSIQLTDRQNFQANLGATSLVNKRVGEEHKRSAASLVLLEQQRQLEEFKARPIWKRRAYLSIG